MKESYQDVPMWWYMVILLVGFFLGLGAVIKGHTTLDPWAYVISIVSTLSTGTYCRDIPKTFYSSLAVLSRRFLSASMAYLVQVSRQTTFRRCYAVSSSLASP